MGKKISQLPAATSIARTDILPIVNPSTGQIKKIAVSDLLGPYNAKWFGAKGDGITNDTSPIQSAVDICASLGGGSVAIPEGTYLCSGINLKSGVKLTGTGMTSTIFKPSVNNVSVIKGYGVRYTSVKSIQIDDNGKTGITAIDYRGAINTPSGNFESIMTEINDVLVNGCDYGIRSTFSYYCTLSKFQCKDTVQALELGSASNSWSFNACSFFCESKGASIVNSAGISFNGCTFEYRSWIEIFNSDGINFTGNYFEDTETPSVLTYWILLGTGDVSTRGISIQGNNFNIGANYGVWCAKVEGLTIKGNTFGTKLFAIAMDKDGNSQKNGIEIGANVYKINGGSHDPTKAIQVVGSSTAPLSNNTVLEIVQSLHLYSPATEPADELVAPNSGIIYQYGQNVYIKLNKAGVIEKRNLAGINGSGEANYFPIYDQIDTVKKSTVLDDGESVIVKNRDFKVRDITTDQNGFVIEVGPDGAVIQSGNSTGSLPLKINPAGGAIEVGATVSGLPATAASHFVTKAQLDALGAIDNTTGTDVEITDSTKGIILKSPNNTRYRITVNNDGSLTTTAL